jgi:hypothetical protein
MRVLLSCHAWTNAFARVELWKAVCLLLARPLAFMPTCCCIARARCASRIRFDR